MDQWSIVDCVTLGAIVATWSHLRMWDRPWWATSRHDVAVYALLAAVVDPVLEGPDHTLAAEVEQLCHAAAKRAAPLPLGFGFLSPGGSA